MAEIHFHLSRAPVFPSATLYRRHEIRVRTSRTLRLANTEALASLGVSEAVQAGYDYRRTQEIGAAAHFLEFDGLMVPSARWTCLNLVLFLERLDPAAELRVEQSVDIDWHAWRSRTSRQRSK